MHQARSSKEMQHVEKTILEWLDVLHLNKSTLAVFSKMAQNFCAQNKKIQNCYTVRVLQFCKICQCSKPEKIIVKWVKSPCGSLHVQD